MRCVLGEIRDDCTQNRTLAITFRAEDAALFADPTFPTASLDVIKELRFLFPVALAVSILGAPSFAVEKPQQFTPQNGFGGLSEGNGTLTLLFGEPRSFHVESLGTSQADGTFRIEQTIQFLGEQPTTRFWVLRTVGPNRYSATLSDAAGPVTGSTSGPRLSLKYRVKGPLFMHQELTLMPDGKTIDNVGVISLFGVPVGHLKETIVRKCESWTPTSGVGRRASLPHRHAVFRWSEQPSDDPQ